MQIVIEIPEETVNKIKNNVIRLIDADELLKQSYCIDDSATLSIRDVVNVEEIDDASEYVLVKESAEPETSRIENALHGKSPEEQYDFIWWLLQNYAMNFTDSRQAAIEWLRGKNN